MKTLQQLITDLDVRSLRGRVDATVHAVTADSRQVAYGTLFIAVKGTAHDGHAFIPQVVKAGAEVIVCERIPEAADTSVTWVEVANSSQALGVIAHTFFDHPTRELKLVGVTGTNGKTTTATLCYQLFTALGYPTGLLSTIENRILKEVLPATHTTPDPVQLNRILRQMVDAGCSHAFMEVSSHAAHQHRIAGLEFSGAVFTNITHDHLDYHGTFDNYIAAKKMFFDALPASAFALVNADDKRASVMLQNTKADTRRFSVKSDGDFTCRIIANEITGLQLKLDGEEFHSRLTGEFNAWNLLAVYSVARLLDLSKQEALPALSALGKVNGRFEVLRAAEQNLTAVVDYAHTPDAVEKVLETLRGMLHKQQGIITVIGCGGDRDKTKRPLMAAAAAKWSTQVVLTSDNPRTEDPALIIRDMENGLDEEMRRHTLSIADRKEAIRTAIKLSRPGDVVLVAGKGHETYQEIMGVKHPFDDKQVITETFQNLNR